MSTWVETTVSCPSCATSNATRIATSVHISRVPEIRKAVLDRTLNRATCSKCGQRIALDVAFTYVDVERGHWLHVEPVRRRADWQSVETDAMRALTRGLDVTSPIISGLAESARRRVVFGTEELREKLIVWDAGIDDGLLECIKLRAWIDEPSLMRARMIANRVTDDGGLELVHVDDARHFAVPASWVDHALDEQPSLEARYPELFHGGYVNALRLIALVLLVLTGCSQPQGHDTPPPRPRDAAAAVADADAVELSAPVDAPPADAGVHIVRWDVLRDQPSSGGAVRVAVQVIMVKGNADESLVVFDRGSAEGIRSGWKGRLLEENHRVFDVFEVTDVENHSCKAHVKARSDQVKRTSMQAVLWDPKSGGEP